MCQFMGDSVLRRAVGLVLIAIVVIRLFIGRLKIALRNVKKFPVKEYALRAVLVYISYTVGTSFKPSLFAALRRWFPESTTSFPSCSSSAIG